MRHKTFKRFWKQEKGDSISTQCGGDVFRELEESYSEDDFFYSCVSVYICRRGTAVENHWETTFFKSMGGKANVRCQCQMHPLVPTYKAKASKLKCNARYFNHANGT